MQDVTPPQNERSIRNIPVPEGRKHFEPMPQEFERTEGGGRKKGRSLWLWGGVVIVACIIIGVLASTLFVGASVTVYPRTANTTPPSSILAGLNAPVGSLSYKILSVSQNAEQTLPAKGTEQASTTAQGTLTVYNNFGTAPQELVTNTRFESPDGRIYRIHQGIVVPGATTNADGSLTPGSVTATAYADQAGSAYNVTAQTQFTIPGFKNSTKYTKFYATASNIAGGFVGMQPAVDQTDKDKAQNDMKAQLTAALQSSLASQLPDGYIEVPGTSAVSYDPLKSTDAGNGNATVSENATESVVILRTADLATAIGRLGVQGYNGEAVDLAKPLSLTVSVASGTPYSSSSTSLTLALSGTANIVWQFDAGAVQQALAGKPRAQFDQIISSFAPAIAKATASLRPFWKKTFPTNPADIKIGVEAAS